MNLHTKPPAIIIVIIIVVVIVLINNNFQLGHRHDEGVLNEGTLIDYSYDVMKRNHTAVAKIDGKLQAVSTWRISYVDKNGKFGRCHLYKRQISGSPLINSHVKCSEQPLSFN